MFRKGKRTERMTLYSVSLACKESIRLNALTFGNGEKYLQRGQNLQHLTASKSNKDDLGFHWNAGCLNLIQNQAGQYLIHFIHLVLITKSESHVAPTSSAARQLVVPIFNSLMSLGDGGIASCKLGKAQVGSGVVGGGGGGKGGRCLTWVGSWLLVGAPAVQVRSTSCTQHATPMVGCYSSNEFRCVQGGVEVHTYLAGLGERTNWLTTCGVLGAAYHCPPLLHSLGQCSTQSRP